MITIHGNGLAGRTLARILSNKQLDVRITGDAHQSRQIVLLNQDTVALMEEIFGHSHIGRSGWQIQGRIVCKPGAEPVRVYMPSLAIAMDDLLSALPQVCSRRCKSPTFQYQIDATGRSSVHARLWQGQRLIRFGQRLILMTETPGCLTESILEFIDTGWVFAFPINQKAVVVQVMVPRFEGQSEDQIRWAISQTKIIKSTVDIEQKFEIGSVCAAPQIYTKIKSGNCLAIGAAAFTMDPICGDGVGSTIRSAILTAAVLEAARDDRESEVFNHLEARHRRSFSTHMKHVAQYYLPLTRNVHWIQELKSTYGFVNQILSNPDQRISESRYSISNGSLVNLSPISV